MRMSIALGTFAVALGMAFHAPGASANKPTKITKCGTIAQPGSYVLAKNLTAAGNCLVVEADFVTIDLAGFLITGDGTGRGIGGNELHPQKPRSIAVRNGTIAGFGDGVVLSLSPGSIVGGVRTVDNTRIGILSVGIVSGNTAIGNGIVGIGATGIVSGNIAEDNTGIGIIIGSGSTVSGNTALRNRRGGISFNEDARGSTVSGNTAQGNGLFGILVRCPSNVIANTATANDGSNLVLSGQGCTNIDNLAP